jgi:putative protease
LRIPELLAPAGDWNCVRAAVENGADAVYFGLSRFNARLRAHNFTEADLPELMAWLHRRGVRGYVTFNTLVFTSELPDAESYLRTLIRAGVDAAIVQDVGICRLIRQLSPDFPIHASTQMTVTSAAGVRFARDLGCQLVVLARENSLPEIERIQSELQDTAASLPLEVFVHGALCVAYSGQCLTSEALGGRSANRGECAQACRMPYDLLSDGQPVPLGDRRYLLSPQDLSGLDLLPDLARAGLTSLKIEGRLKSPEYVASITRTYRQALDRLSPAIPISGTTQTPTPPPTPSTPDPVQTRYELEMAFSRGLHPGWLAGSDNQKLVHGRFGKKRGAYLGEVLRVQHHRVWILPQAPVKAGDGVVFDAGRPDQPEQGGRILTLQSHPHQPQEVGLSFRSGALDLLQLRPGHKVWKTSDPALDKELRLSYQRPSHPRTQPVSAEVHGLPGSPLTLLLRDAQGNLARTTSTLPLAEAHNQPLDLPRLRDQLGRLGGTGYHLDQLHADLPQPVILPLAELNRLRREAVTQLDALRSQPPHWSLLPQPALPLLLPLISPPPATPPIPSPPLTLAVLVRTFPQLEAALNLQVPAIYCEFEDPKRYRDAVARIRTSPATQVLLAPPRIFKPGEDWILKLVRSAEPDGFLFRNHHQLETLPVDQGLGDFSLNVANPIAAQWFHQRYHLPRLTPSYDLNADQLVDLLRAAPPDWFEITLHQHMPMFHMEHCVFCAFLSKGRDYRDCGRPCDRHAVQLRDRVGAAHPVKADAGCRNTVFNARAQTGAEYLPRLLAAGASRFRLEFLDESQDETTRLITQYRRLLRGEIDGATLWREFRLINQLGVTRGQMGRASGSDLGIDRWTDTQAYAASW